MNSATTAPLIHPLGVAIGDMTPPEQIGETARWLEQLGYSHITIPEDCWYIPALVGVTLALSATDSVPVGTSIVSALTRHPSILAMELAGISRAFPGRFRAGIGLGLPEWLDQMGIRPERAVGALKEAVTAIRRLADGETVTAHGRHVQLDGIGITHPVTAPMPITLGVIGPMMLRLSGQVADTTLFGAAAGLDYFRYAIPIVQEGARSAGRDPEQLTFATVALVSVNRDAGRALEVARPVLAGFLGEFGVNVLSDAYGISDELSSMLERGGESVILEEMPDRWVQDLMLVGTPEMVAEQVRSWVDAGIDSIAMFLPHESERDVLTLVAEEVIPRLR
jgi:alkanesulfonate monooxygenase SsuD/methylene tetrahydromethanopterin reductase-like flavin-dependent oxidoreductase (luciferase family)